MQRRGRYKSSASMEMALYRFRERWPQFIQYWILTPHSWTPGIRTKSLSGFCQIGRSSTYLGLKLTGRVYLYSCLYIDGVMKSALLEIDDRINNNRPDVYITIISR